MIQGSSLGLKIGIIGTGAAASAHAEVIQALGCEIAAVCSRPESTRAAPFVSRFAIPRQYDNVEEMLAGLDLDGVVVAISWDQTEAVMRTVIDKRIPCLVEKPVALSSEKAEGLWKLAGGDSALIQVGYNRRFYDFVPKVRNRIAAEPPLSIDLQCPEVIAPLVSVHGERILPHILAYMTSHWLDLVSYLIGELAILSMMRTPHSSGKFMVGYDGLLCSTTTSIPVHLRAHLGTPSQTSLTITFREEIWRLCPIERLTIYDGLTRHEPTELVPYRRYEPHVSETVEVDWRFKPGFHGQMQEFVHLMTSSPEPRTGCSLGEAIQVMRLCEKIQGLA